MCQPEAFYNLAVQVKERGLNIVTYTGFTYEELITMGESNIGVKKLMDLTDILVDGRFVLEERDLTLPFRGSANQRLIDMNLTRERGKLTLAEI